MTSKVVALFHGDKEDENPEDFLQSFFRCMGTSKDDIMKQQFPNYLQADSVTDEWFDELQPADKKDWDAIEAAFHKRWPRKKAARKTTEEYEEEITGLQLRMEDLGKKEKVTGRDIYSDRNQPVKHHQSLHECHWRARQLILQQKLIPEQHPKAPPHLRKRIGPPSLLACKSIHITQIPRQAGRHTGHSRPIGRKRTG